VSTLVGCAPETYDGVLWRQVAAFKDLLGDALASATGTPRETFLAAVKSDGTNLPEA